MYRTIVTLGYHRITDSTTRDETDEEIHWCISWCYMLDTAMSMLFLRPKELPKPSIPVVSLIPLESSRPGVVIFRLFLELSKVQEVFMEITLSPRWRDGDRLIRRLDSLSKDMATIYDSIQEVSHSNRNEHDLDLLLHIWTLEFTFHSILTAILRLNPSLRTDTQSREKYLSCAREALMSFRNIQVIISGEKARAGVYDLYLSWPISTNPLCPYFIIFCDVVCTTNIEDFRLLQDIATGFSDLHIPNNCCDRLQRLCNSLVSFCQPLFEKSNGLQPTTNATPDLVDSTQFDTKGQPRPVPWCAYYGHSNTAAQDNSGCGGMTSRPQPSEAGYSTLVPNKQNHEMTNSWNEDLMWQLFGTQPSLDWSNFDLNETTTGHIIATHKFAI